MIQRFRFWDKGYKIWLTPDCVWLDDKGSFRGVDGVNRFESVGQDLVVMQSTGVFDVNGKEIFEGDVVRLHSGELLPVKLHHGMFEPVCYYINNVFEKVGNIFENPELLESQDFREVPND